MSATLRLSPSGPYLNNANGGGFAPGPGAVLRMDAVQAPLFPATSAANIPSAGVANASQVVCVDGVGTGNTWVAALEQPDPNKNYRVTGVLDVTSATTAGASITQFLDVSNDGGTTFSEVASVVHAIGPGAAAADVRQIRIDMVSRTGAALNVDPGDAELVFRMRVTSPTPAGSAALPQISNPTNANGNPVGTLYMELVEMF